MADHDRRRKAMRRKQRSLTRSEGTIHAVHQEMGGQIINFGRGFVAVKGTGTDGDLEDEDHVLNHDLSHTLTARAA